MEEQLHEHTRTKLVKFMRREIRTHLLSGILLRSAGQFLEEERLGWFVDAFMGEGWGICISESEIRDKDTLLWVAGELYEDTDIGRCPLRDSFAYLSYAAEARAMGNKEKEQEWLERSVERYVEVHS